MSEETKVQKAVDVEDLAVVKTYVDQEVSGAKSYADQGVETAKSYTDQEANSAKTYVDQSVEPIRAMITNLAGKLDVVNFETFSDPNTGVENKDVPNFWIAKGGGLYFINSANKALLTDQPILSSCFMLSMNTDTTITQLLFPITKTEYDIWMRQGDYNGFSSWTKIRGDKKISILKSESAEFSHVPGWEDEVEVFLSMENYLYDGDEIEIHIERLPLLLSNDGTHYYKGTDSNDHVLNPTYVFKGRVYKNGIWRSAQDTNGVRTYEYNYMIHIDDLSEWAYSDTNAWPDIIFRLPVVAMSCSSSTSDAGGFAALVEGISSLKFSWPRKVSASTGELKENAWKITAIYKIN